MVEAIQRCERLFCCYWIRIHESLFPDPVVMLKVLCSGGLYKAGVVEKSLVDVYVPFLPLERRHVLLCVRQEASKRSSFLYILFCHSVGDVFGPPGSGSISQRYGSGSGSFPFLKNVLSGLKY